MKKLTILAALFATITATKSFANTSGHYAGINVLKASAKTKTSKDISTFNSDTYFNSKSEDSSINFGFDYQYAINKNNFFVAPGLFYENLNTEAKVNDTRNGWSQNLKLNNRYGLKLDVGYDVSKLFAIYVPLEYAITNYEFSTHDYTNNSSLRTKRTASDSSFFYGLGVAFAPSDKILVKLQYTRSELDLQSVSDVALVNTVRLKAKTNLDIIKLGFAYRF